MEKIVNNSNIFRVVGTLVKDINKLSDNVSRITLLVTSNTGKDGKTINSNFNFVAFRETAALLNQCLSLNDKIMVEGHLANSSYMKGESRVYQLDLVIDKFKKID